MYLYKNELNPSLITGEDEYFIDNRQDQNIPSIIRKNTFFGNKITKIYNGYIFNIYC